MTGPLTDADRSRAATLAHQTRRDRKTKTELGLAIHWLEQAQKAARVADRDEQATVISRLIREATDLLRGWPSHERVAS